MIRPLVGVSLNTLTITSLPTVRFSVFCRSPYKSGRKAELELWDKTEERLRHFGLVAPRIEVKADMQRYNTIELMGPQNDIVSPTFDFMYQQIIEPKELTK